MKKKIIFLDSHCSLSKYNNSLIDYYKQEVIAIKSFWKTGPIKI